jgi:hypothetical protein
MGKRNRAAVVMWSPMMIAAAAGVAWSLGAREPDAPPVAHGADRDAVVAHKGDYLIPKVKPPPDLAARWAPLVPAAKIDGGPPKEGLLSIEGPPPPEGPPRPDPPSSPAREPVRAEATPHHQAGARRDRDGCAAQGMRREDVYQDNRWRSWRCVR